MKMLVVPVLAALFAVALGGMTGGFQDIDISEARDMLDIAVAKHNRGTNDRFLRQVAQVVSVRRQVVAGYNYEITVQMGRTPCLKASAENEVCTVHQDPALAELYTCKFNVWSRPWIPDTQVKEKC